MPDNNRWLRNFGRSVKFSAKEVLRDMAPTITGTVTDATADLRGIRDTLQYAKRRNEVIAKYLTGGDPELIDELIKAKKTLGKAIHTGKFYQSESEQMDAVSAFLGDDMDMKSLMKEFDDDEGEDGEPSSITPKEMAKIGKGIASASTEGAMLTTQAVNSQTAVMSSGFQVTNNAINTLGNHVISVMEIAAKEHTELFTGISNGISAINQFNDSAVSPYFKASVDYYNESLTLFREMNESLKTMSGKGEAPEAKNPRYSNEIYDLISGDNGYKLSNLMAYGALNSRKKLDDNLGGMLSMVNSDMVKMLTASGPAAFIMQGLLKSLIPTSIESAAKALDKSFKAFIPALFSKLNDYTGDNTGMSILSSIFGLELTSSSKKLDLSNYNKGAVAFDGITRKAITEVIPSYLAKILQTMQKSKSSMVYDYENGKFVSTGKLDKEFRHEARNARLAGLGDAESEMDDYLYKKNIDTDNRKLITKTFKRLFDEKVKRGEGFDYTKDEEYANIKDEQLRKIVRQVITEALSNSSKIALRGSAVEYGGKQSAEFVDRAEQNGMYAVLKNGMFKNEVTTAKLARQNNKVVLIQKPEKYGKGKFKELAATRDKKLEGVMNPLKRREIVKEYENAVNNMDTTTGKPKKPMSLKDVQSNLNKQVEVPKELVDSGKKDGGWFSTVKKYYDKPATIIADAVRGLDASLHDIIFGDKGSVFHNIIKGIQTTFSNTFEWIKNSILLPVKEGLFGKNFGDTKVAKGISSFILGDKDADGKYTGGLLSGLRNEASNMWDQTKEAWSDEVVPILKDAGNTLQEYIAPSTVSKDGKPRKPIVDMVYDGLSTGFTNFAGAIFGSNDGKFDAKGFTNTSARELRAKIPKSLAIGGLGAGLGVANGLGAFGLVGQWFLPGGPIAGLIVGSMVGLASQSNIVKDTLFGKEAKQADGTTKRVGGVVSAKTQDWLKSNKVPILGGAMFGVTKAVLFGGTGLVPGIAMAAFGPAIMGSAVGLAVKSKYVQELLYGRDDKQADGTTKKVGGLFNKRAIATIHKALPNMGAGAVLGIGANSVIGSMGLIGSMIATGPIPAAIMGAGLGFAMTSKKMTRRLFGYTDEKGEYHAGIFDKIGNAISLEIIKPFKLWAKESFYDLKNWFRRSVGIPLARAFYPLTLLMKSIGQSIKRGFENSVGRIFKGFTGILTTMLTQTRNAFSLITGGIGSAVATAVNVGAKIASLPINLGVGAISTLAGIGEINARNKARHQAVTDAKTRVSTEGMNVKNMAHLVGSYFNFNNTKNEEVNELNKNREHYNEDSDKADRRYNLDKADIKSERAELKRRQSLYRKFGYDNSDQQNAEALARIEERKRDVEVDKNTYRGSGNAISAISKDDTPELQVAKAGVQYEQKQVGLLTTIANAATAIQSSVTGESSGNENNIDAKEFSTTGKMSKAARRKAKKAGSNTLNFGSFKTGLGGNAISDNEVGGKTYEWKKAQDEKAAQVKRETDQLTFTKSTSESSLGILTNVKTMAKGFGSLFKQLLMWAPAIIAGIAGIAGLIYKLANKGVGGTGEDVADEFNGRRGANAIRNVGYLGARGFVGIKNWLVDKGLVKNKSLWETGKSAVKGVANFVRHPIDSIMGKTATTGTVGKMYGIQKVATPGGGKMALSAPEGAVNKVYGVGRRKIVGGQAAETGSKILNSEKISQIMTDFTNNSTVKNLFGDKLGKVVEGLTGFIRKFNTPTILKKLGTGLAKAGKGVARVASVGATLGVAQLAFSAYDAYSGYSDAPYIFSQPEETLTWKQKGIAVVNSILWGLPPCYLLDLGLSVCEGVVLGLIRGTPVETIANALGIDIDSIDHRRATALLMFQYFADEKELSDQQAASGEMNNEYADYVAKMKEAGQQAEKKEDWMKSSGKVSESFLSKIGNFISHPIDTLFGKKDSQFTGGGEDKGIVAKTIDVVSAAKDSASKLIADGINSTAGALGTAFDFISGGIKKFIKMQTSPYRMALAMFGFDMDLDDNEKNAVTGIQTGIGNMMNWFGEKFAAFGEGFGKFIQNGLEAMQGLSQKIVDTANNVVTTAKNVVLHPIDTLSNGASWAWSKVKNFFTGSGQGRPAHASIKRPKFARSTSSRRGFSGVGNKSHRFFSGGGANGEDLDLKSFNDSQYTSSMNNIASNIEGIFNSGQTPADILSQIIRGKRIGGNNGNGNRGSSDNVNSQNLEGNAKRIYEFLRQQGYSNTAAAGIMGNLQQEHNFSTKDVGEHVNEDGLTYGGLGIVQWNGSRTQSLREYAAQTGRDPEDLDLQLDFMMKEINDGYHSVNQDSLNALGSAEEVAAKWNSDYEGGTETGKRQAYASDILNKINSNGFSGAGLWDTISDYASTAKKRLFNNPNAPSIADTGSSYNENNDNGGVGLNDVQHSTPLIYDSFGFGNPIKYFMQNNPEWINEELAPAIKAQTGESYGTIGDKGCGLVSVADAIVNNTKGNVPADPKTLSSFLGIDDVDKEGGIKSTMEPNNVFTRLGKSMGNDIDIQPFRGTYSDFKEQLKAGSGFILGGKGGAPFSDAGHYVYAAGYGNGEDDTELTGVMDPLGTNTATYDIKKLKAMSVANPTSTDPNKQDVPGVAYVVNPKIPNPWGDKAAKAAAAKAGSAGQSSGGQRGLPVLLSYMKLCAEEYMNSIIEGRPFKAPAYKKLADGSFLIGDQKANGSNGNYGPTKEGSALGQQAVGIMRSKIDKVPFRIPAGTSCMKTIGESLPGTKFDGMAYVPNAVSMAKEAGIFKTPGYKPAAGDVIVTGNEDHVSMLTDKGGVIQNGNSGTYNGEKVGGVYESSYSPEDMFGENNIYGYLAINEMNKGNKAFIGSGSGLFGRYGNAYGSSNPTNLLAHLGVQWLGQSQRKKNNIKAQRNAFLKEMAKGYRGQDKNNDAWNDLLAGDSNLATTLGISAKESDPSNIGKKPSFWEQVLNKTLGRPSQMTRNGQTSTLLIAKKATHAIDWESKAKIMNNAYQQALIRQGNGDPQLTAAIISQIKAITDATQQRADNMTPAEKAAVVEMRKNASALANKVADANSTWVKVKVGDKVGYVARQYLKINGDNTAVLTGDDVNFREQPSMSANVISTLAKGTKVTCEATNIPSVQIDPKTGKVVEPDIFAKKRQAYEMFNAQLKQGLGQTLTPEEEDALEGKFSSSSSSVAGQLLDSGMITKTLTNNKVTPATKGKISKSDIVKLLQGQDVDISAVGKAAEQQVKANSFAGGGNTIKAVGANMPALTSNATLENAIKSLDVHAELNTIIKYLANMSGTGGGNTYIVDSNTGKRKIVDTGKEYRKPGMLPLTDKINELGDSSKDDKKALDMLNDAIAIAKGGTFRTVKA